ncbi:MAG TPA: hypothetical protein VEX86_20465 [Longimicrobium sp.]|nr:hypothetical protein [Longimicrobium sp.]
MVRALTFLALGLVVACATTRQAPTAGLGGTYALVEVDGQPLSPQTEGEPGYILDAGSVTFASPGRFTLYVRAHRAGTSESMERTLGGTYTVAGTTITLTPDDSAEASGAPEPLTIEPGGRLVSRSSGKSLVFQRR